MPPKDSIANTFIVSLVLCIVCSLLVSGAAVSLKPRQKRNQELDQKRNIIEAASLSEDPKGLSGKEVEEIFDSQVTRQLLDIDSDNYVSEPDPSFDPRQAAKDDSLNVEITGSEFDIGFAKREQQTWVYLVKDTDGKIKKVVLPIYGMGLWGPLYGFVAIDSDFRTIQGLTFYEHKETPGLGGEVDNKLWKAKWVGKQIWEEVDGNKNIGDDEHLMVGVAKGAPLPEKAKYMVDGLSGATITSRGVDSMLNYWFSENGFGPYLKKLAAQQGDSDGSPNG
ncbi:MAG: Na(+)-translocating NADH-quinone reductase subunit C [Planctomycetales bacterium]|nr:Na(+)-translocating NADH-quinone reductase subunit C [Planctomycetales bacterium]